MVTALTIATLSANTIQDALDRIIYLEQIKEGLSLAVNSHYRCLSERSFFESCKEKAEQVFKNKSSENYKTCYKLCKGELKMDTLKSTHKANMAQFEREIKEQGRLIEKIKQEIPKRAKSSVHPFEDTPLFSRFIIDGKAKEGFEILKDYSEQYIREYLIKTPATKLFDRRAIVIVDEKGQLIAVRKFMADYSSSYADRLKKGFLKKYELELVERKPGGIAGVEIKSYPGFSSPGIQQLPIEDAQKHLDKIYNRVAFLYHKKAHIHRKLLNKTRTIVQEKIGPLYALRVGDSFNTHFLYDRHSDISIIIEDTKGATHITYYPTFLINEMNVKIHQINKKIEKIQKEKQQDSIESVL